MIIAKMLLGKTIPRGSFFLITLSGLLLFGVVFFIGLFDQVAAQSESSLDVGGRVMPSPLPIDVFNILEQNISSHAAQVTWETDISANCRFFYGLTLDYELGTIEASTDLMLHSVWLNNLQQGTKYYYRIYCWTGPSSGQTGALDLTTTLDPPDFSVSTSGQNALLEGIGPPNGVIHLTIYQGSRSVWTATTAVDSNGRWRYTSPELSNGSYDAIAYASLGEQSSDDSSLKPFNIESSNDGDNDTDDESEEEDDDGRETVVKKSPTLLDDNLPVAKIEKSEPNDSPKTVRKYQWIPDFSALDVRNSQDEPPPLLASLADNVAYYALAQMGYAFLLTMLIMFAVFPSATGLIVGWLPFMSNILSGWRRKDWGVIYQSDNGWAVPFMTVCLMNSQGEVIEKTVSDKYGFYGFRNHAGQGKIEIEKNQGIESIIPGGNESFYLDNYTNANNPQNRKVSSRLNIALLLKRNGNIRQKKEYSSDGLAIMLLLGLAAHSILSFYLPPIVIVFIFAIYGLSLYVYANLVTFARPGLLFIASNKGAKGAVIRAYEEASGTLFAGAIADKKGEFQLSLMPGSYRLVAQSANRKANWNGQISVKRKQSLSKRIVLS